MAMALLCSMGAICGKMSAEVRMSPLFTDNMVLQQKTDAPVWGTADPGAQVQVSTSWNKRVYTVNAGQDGKWMVKVATPKAGGPYSISVKENGTDSRTIDNVLIGEVWLCSGQSNMEMPVKGWGKVMNYEQELKDAAKYPKIRFLEVQKGVSPVPDTEFTADADGWMVCSPETLEEFSSTAYFFGRELHLKKNVPVGLINTSWGGTIIEAWMSRESLTGVESLEDEAARVAAWPADRKMRQDASESSLKHWNDLIAAFDKTYMDLDRDMYESEYDDSSWDEIPVPGIWELNGYGDPVYTSRNYAWERNYVNNPPYPPVEHNYVGQYRRSFDIPDSWKGKDVFLHIGSAISNVRVWINGKEVGYSEDSKLEACFDITKYIHTGKNSIALEIFRWCDATYLEDQDMWRLSGIARDVFLTAREKKRLEKSQETRLRVYMNTFRP